MSFVYPTFLYALSLIAIPLIIHLFNFRRYKTVYFTNVRFLKEVKEETAVRSKLKHWLVLISRILAVAFLVLAFAQPFIPVTEAQPGQEGKQGVSIYIDNSFSMNAKTDEEPLFNRAKRKAIEILDAYGEEARFQLLTNDFEARHQRFVSKEEFLSLLDEIEITPATRSLKEVQALQNNVFEKSDIQDKVAYWITDFQQNMVNFEADTTISLSLIPLQPLQQHNVYIDSCWFEKPMVYMGQPNQLFVRLNNTGDKAIESSRLTLSINDQVKALSDFSVSANDYTIDTINFSVKEAGWKEVKVSITDYPVTFDDKYYLTFKVTDQVNVLAINEEEESRFLGALYEHADKFVFQNQPVNQLDYARLGTFSLIVLNNLMSVPSGLAYELEQYLTSGGAVVIFPNSKAQPESYNEFFNMVNANTIIGATDQKTPVTYLNQDHELFKDVFEEIPDNVSLPSANLYFRFGNRTQSSEQKLLGFRNGDAFVSQYSYKLGKLYVCASPLNENYTDYPVHALFVPMLYKMALSGGTSKKPAYTLGEEEVIEVDNELDDTDEIYRVRGANTEFIPYQKAIGPKVLLSFEDQVLEAGIYNILKGEEADGQLLALNYNRDESKLKYLTADELEEQYQAANIKVIDAVEGSITEFVKELDKGVVLWKVCIIFALIFIGVEVLLLRLLP